MRAASGRPGCVVTADGEFSAIAASIFPNSLVYSAALGSAHEF